MTRTPDTSTAERHLCEFLASHFVYGELIAFIKALPIDDDFVPLLLPEQCPWNEVTSHTVDLLRRHGILSPMFFEHLTKARSRLSDEIQAIANEWCIVPEKPKKARRKKGIRLKLQLDFESVAESEAMRTQILALLKDHLGEASLQIEAFWRGSVWISVAGPDSAIRLLRSNLLTGALTALGPYKIEGYSGMTRPLAEGDLDDWELLEQWKQGSNEHGSQLLDRVFDEIYTFFRNKISDQSSIDDLLQETFISLPRTVPRLPTSFRAHLFRIARNVLFAYFRSQSRSRRPELTSREDVRAESSAISAINRDREMRLLARAMRELPLDMMIVLELYYGLAGQQAFTAQEIGEMYGLPEDTVRSRIRRARQLLQKAVEKLQQDTALIHAGMDTSSFAA